MKFLLRVFYESLNEDIALNNISINTNNSYLNNGQSNRNSNLPVSKNDEILNTLGTSGLLKPMSPISKKNGNMIDSNKPVVPPISTNNDFNKNETIVDLKDEYNKWFYGELSPIQIFNLVKEAKLASSKLMTF